MKVGGAEYPRRLIEVDLPISEISAHARDGRSVHRGHITAIHIWWARKPLPSCRAATLAAALLDPEDPLCPKAFLDVAAAVLSELYQTADRKNLRKGLLRLVSEFSSWQRAGDPQFLAAARTLVRAAHQAVFEAGPAFLADPFCGGGSIPLEGLRLGTDAYASDLNPVATLISKVTLEYVQRFGDELLHEVERWGQWIAKQAAKKLTRYYPHPDSETPIAYLSFRRIRCEGPRCGADVVLTNKFHLMRKGAKSIGLRHTGWNGSTPKFAIAEGSLKSFPEGTVRRGAATCLRCGYTIPVERVRAQLSGVSGGAATALLVAVAINDAAGNRQFRLPTQADLDALARAQRQLRKLSKKAPGQASIVPSELLPPIGTLGFRVQRYGMLRWQDLFTPRQLLTITTLVGLLRKVRADDQAPDSLGVAVRSCLALAVDRLCDYQNTGCSWNPSGSALPHLFTRQALPIIWDYGEANPLAGSSGSWSSAVAHVLRGLRNAMVSDHGADVGRASASHHPLPTDCAHLLVTDPPYYDAIPYADLSDFFYVWLRRMLAEDHPGLFRTELVPRDEECIVNPVAGKDRDYYRRVMTQALAEARRVTRPDGIGVIIFAHKSTSGWEDLLAAMLDAGWIITASWPIDTENSTRLRARNSAVLASSIHLVCRPREYPDGELVMDTVGDWRDILAELPRRIHAWMPRLAREGIVGADAIFACLGPALELFSRFARVEKVSGETVMLAEYLEHVWAAVAREALSMIFEEADATGLDAGARLTAMWLWTLSTGSDRGDFSGDESRTDVVSGFTLEFDAARKIAQGLGARLEELSSIVEVAGDKARLLSVVERSRYLLRATPRVSSKSKKRTQKQLTLFDELKSASSEEQWGELGALEPGRTILDQVHQAMLLFGAGRGDALRRFVVDTAVGRQTSFWKLAQSLAALYPSGCDEKRWVEGILARKKSMGYG